MAGISFPVRIGARTFILNSTIYEIIRLCSVWFLSSVQLFKRIGFGSVQFLGKIKSSQFMHTPIQHGHAVYLYLLANLVIRCRDFSSLVGLYIEDANGFSRYMFHWLFSFLYLDSFVHFNNFQIFLCSFSSFLFYHYASFDG